LNIRLSGPKLGRPSNNKEKLVEQRKVEYADSGIRNAVEGRFGVGKRRYSLNRIMARLHDTSKSAIALIFLVMNLDALIHFLALFFYGSMTSHIKEYALRKIIKKANSIIAVINRNQKYNNKQLCKLAIIQ